MPQLPAEIIDHILLYLPVNISIGLKREYPKRHLLKTLKIETARSFEHAQWLHHYDITSENVRDYTNAYNECAEEYNFERLAWLVEHCNLKYISYVLEDLTELGSTEVVKFLSTKCGAADVWNALISSAKLGRLEIMEILAAKVPKEFKSTYHWDELLCIAAENGRTDIVKFLLDHDAGSDDREDVAIFAALGRSAYPLSREGNTMSLSKAQHDDISKYLITHPPKSNPVTFST